MPRKTFDRAAVGKRNPRRGGVNQRSRSGLAWVLGRHEDERQIAQAIETHPNLAASLEPRELDDDRIGIVVDEELLEHVRTAISA